MKVALDVTQSRESLSTHTKELCNKQQFYTHTAHTRRRKMGEGKRYIYRRGEFLSGFRDRVGVSLESCTAQHTQNSES